MLAEGVATRHAMPGRRIGFAAAAMGSRKRIVRRFPAAGAVAYPPKVRATDPLPLPGAAAGSL